MWVYAVRTGELSRAGKVIAKGYSGRGAGLNNPDKETVRALGPIPRGRWHIGPSRTGSTGPVSMPLTPVGHDAHGRSAFLIHGDNSTPAPNDASHGCIILRRVIREMIDHSEDKDLEVV